MKQWPLTLGTLALSGLSHAHEGHGASGAMHWHATDALGFAVAAVAVAAVWWLGRGK